MSLSWSDKDDANIPLIKFYEPDSEFLNILSTSKFPKNELAKSSSQLETIRSIMSWSNNLWKHDGANDPGTMDPKVILARANKGENFRCVEYSVIMASAAAAVNLKARVVGLRTKDVETAEYGAGHIVTEVYNEDLMKWIMIDPQMALIPLVEDVPVSVFELVKAVSEAKKIKFLGNSGEAIPIQEYLDWLTPYLYYIAFRIDQRYGLNSENVDQIILLPIGAKVPEKFQRRPIPGKVFGTSSPESIYARASLLGK